MREELKIDDFVTHTFNGLDKVNDSIHALHDGTCLRAVIHINDYELKSQAMKFKQTSNVKVEGGYIKQIKHGSKSNNCEMTFSIFLPD
jgi:hypothetical protein